MDVRGSYDSAARVYAEHVAGELAHKPLDRALLNRFAEATRGRGLVAELGCGPGHVARYLSGQGVVMVGIDLSPEMIRVASELHPGIEYRVGDMTRLDLADGGLAGVVAFYATVHLAIHELPPVFVELRRVLAAGGFALIGFHVGDEVVHRDELFGAPVALDFRFHEPEAVVRELGRARLTVLERVEREPYEGVEFPSRRCYLLARAD